MLNVFKLNVIMLSVVMLNVIMLSVIMLNAFTFSVVAPSIRYNNITTWNKKIVSKIKTRLRWKKTIP